MATKDEAFPSRYLKATDIEGKQPIATIDRVEREELQGDRGTELKYVMYFKGVSKGLILNSTNWDMVEYLTKQRDSDNWPGHKIMLVMEEVAFKGKITPAIRIKRPPPQPTPRKVVTEDRGTYKTSTTEPIDEAPFNDDPPDFR